MKNITTIGSVPLWAWVLVGWMAAGAGTALWQRGSLERTVGDPQAVVESVDMDWDLDTMSARELQALPGIGKKRAVDLAEARWQHDPADGDFDMQSVEGIGEKTAAAAHTFVSERRATPLPPTQRALGVRLPNRGPVPAATLRLGPALRPTDERLGIQYPPPRSVRIRPPISRPQ